MTSTQIGADMTEEERAGALAELDEDGATFALADGRSLRLRIGPDDVNPFDETDIYGAIGWSVPNVVTGRDQRPDGFTGNAEKLYDRGGPVWWEPPADGPARTDRVEFAKFRRLVRDLLECGWSIVTLELLQGADAYGRPIVRAAASLAGLEPSCDSDYLADVLGDLLDEVTAT
jgi:hypothetical protein